MPSQLLGVVGSRNTGKTTTVRIIANALSEIGLNIAIIKFSHHKFTSHPPNKDSTVLRDTKAKIVVSATPYEIVYYERLEKRHEIPELLRMINKNGNSIDLIICESYPANYPQIPLIFTCKSEEDYQETKKRYNTQKPLFITGLITQSDISMIEGIPVLLLEPTSEDFSRALSLLKENPVER